MPEQKPEGKAMRLKITSCVEGYTGKNQRGDEYSIYEIKAEKPDGTPINETLRSFGALPIGQLVDVTVTPYKSERYGKSFTLSGKKGSSGATAAAINDVNKKIATLEQRVADLELRLGHASHSSGTTGAAEAAGAVAAHPVVAPT